MAVVDRQVRLVAEAGTVQQVAELRAGEAVFAPVDLAYAAAPGLVLEDGSVAFGELPVAPTVVRNDEDRIFGEGRVGRVIESVARHHLVGDARGAVTSAEMGPLGSLKAENVSWTPTIRPSDV